MTPLILCFTSLAVLLLAIALACERLGLPQPTEGTHRLFSGQETGLGVQLPGWMYPVVCNPATGQLRYDNYGGRWGEQMQLVALGISLW